MIPRRVYAVMLVSILALTAPFAAWAQVSTGGAAAPRAFTLEQAIQYAVDHYPTVRAALEAVNVSTAGVSVARAGPPLAAPTVGVPRRLSHVRFTLVNRVDLGHAHVCGNIDSDAERDQRCWNR